MADLPSPFSIIVNAGKQNIFTTEHSEHPEAPIAQTSRWSLHHPAGTAGIQQITGQAASLLIHTTTGCRFTPRT